jgi:DNA-binding MarR family transcriptional regulator
MPQHTSSPENADSMEDSAREVLSQLPPSAKLVAKTLGYNGSLTQAQLANKTLLPERTVRYALRKLETHDLVESQICLTDARKCRYYIDFEY